MHKSKYVVVDKADINMRLTLTRLIDSISPGKDKGLQEISITFD